MLAFIRSLAILVGLCGLMLLYTSCSDDDRESPPTELEFAHQAEHALLQTISIDSGAVVSFVGPAESGSQLVISDKYVHDWETAFVEVPEAPGRYYLFFVNDYPELRYEHPVRYVCLDIAHGQVEVVNTQWPPILMTTPPDTMEFQLIEADTLAGVIFYYGRGGGYGFPSAYWEE